MWTKFFFLLLRNVQRKWIGKIVYTITAAKWTTWRKTIYFVLCNMFSAKQLSRFIWYFVFTLRNQYGFDEREKKKKKKYKYTRYYFDCTVAHIVNIRNIPYLVGRYIVYHFFHFILRCDAIVLNIFLFLHTIWMQCILDRKRERQSIFYWPIDFHFCFAIYYNLILNFIRLFVRRSFISPQCCRLFRFSFISHFSHFFFVASLHLCLATKIPFFRECEFIFAISSSLCDMGILFAPFSYYCR